MTRILFVVNSMQTGGAERVAATLVNAWAERGWTVTLLATYSGRGECHYAISKKASVVYLSDLSGVTGRSVWGYCQRYLALRRFIRKVSPRVVISFLTDANVAAILGTRGLNVPVIVSERIHPPAMPLSWMWKKLRHLTYPWAERVVMLTGDGLKWLNAAIPSARGVIIPNPVAYPMPSVEPKLAVSEWVKPDHKLLLAVGRLDKQKQFDALLEAFSRLSEKFTSWDLVILGDGAERPSLEEQINRLGLCGRVVMPGRVGNVGEWYRRADLYVMSSRFEGFPNTLAEAMAHGCAVVSYDCDTGPRDIIRPGVDGLLVKAVGDVTALATALDALMSDDTKRLRMGKAAMEMRERYSLSKVLDRWDDLIIAVAPESAA